MSSKRSGVEWDAIEAAYQDEYGHDGNWLPKPCIVCGEETEARCVECHTPQCHDHDECPSGCGGPTYARPASPRKVILGRWVSKPAEKPGEGADHEWIAEPVTELYTALDFFEPKSGRVIWVQLTPGDWIEGRILDFKKGAVHVEVRGKIDSPPWS